MYSVLGWLNVVVLGVILSPYVLGFLNKKVFKTQSKGFRSTMKFLRRLHKPLGIAMAVLALVHGYLALGGFRLHTGSLLYLSIFITALLGGSFYKLKKRALFTWHKRMALVSFLLLLLHLFYPSALYYILN
jgi:cytochrome b561